MPEWLAGHKAGAERSSKRWANLCWKIYEKFNLLCIIISGHSCWSLELGRSVFEYPGKYLAMVTINLKSITHKGWGPCRAFHKLLPRLFAYTFSFTLEINHLLIGQTSSQQFATDSLVLPSTLAIYFIFYLKTLCTLLVNYSHMNEMLAYQFLCHTHTYYFSIYIRVSVRGVACEFCFLFFVSCVLCVR